MEAILAHEPAIRLGCFLGVFALVAAWEGVAPRRVRAFSRWRRWPGNLGIVVLNTVVLRLAFPIAAVGMAGVAAARGWGVLNLVQLPEVAEVALAVVAMDFAIWLQHVMVHAVPVLWRLHRMHHADLDYDVTTGARFHPLEIVLSMGIKLAVVALLGPSAVAVIVFEVALNATAMFNHGNIRLPEPVDRVLRWLIVTPDMHRVHHSVRREETDSNFGFNLPWWDRLFGTYRDQPADGHDGMTIGLEVFRDAGDLRLDRMLLQPFRGMGGGAGRVAVGLALAAAVGLAIVYRDSLDPAQLERLIEASGPWGPAIFILLFAAGTVLFVPGVAYALAGGALFGPVLGTVYNLSGATLGAVLAFLVARHGGGEWVRGRTGPRLNGLVSGVEAEGWRFVAFVRLVPLFPFNLMNYAFGLTRIGLGEYTVATAVCMIPGGLAYTYLGFAGREAVAGGADAIRQGLIALALLAAALFLPRLVKRMRRGGTAPGVERMDVTALRQAMGDGRDLRLIDLRDPADFTGESGHVGGAVNIPLPALKGRMAELDDWRDRPVAVMCRTDMRSKSAIAALGQQGFTRLILIDGGMVEWTRRGLPVERG